MAHLQQPLLNSTPPQDASPGSVELNEPPVPLDEREKVMVHLCLERWEQSLSSSAGRLNVRRSERGRPLEDGRTFGRWDGSSVGVQREERRVRI